MKTQYELTIEWGCQGATYIEPPSGWGYSSKSPLRTSQWAGLDQTKLQWLVCSVPPLNLTNCPVGPISSRACGVLLFQGSPLCFHASHTLFLPTPRPQCPPCLSNSVCIHCQGTQSLYKLMVTLNTPHPPCRVYVGLWGGQGWGVLILISIAKLWLSWASWF